MGNAGSISIDAHAHYRPCFDVHTFLKYAHYNLSAAAAQVSDERHLACVLFVLGTSPENGDGFRRLRKVIDRELFRSGANCKHWEIQAISERSCMCLVPRGGVPLLIISGRQIQSLEQLEVLALGTTRKFDQGQSIDSLIRTISQAGALPVLPWGVGKWLGKRGKVVKNLIESQTLPDFFLGDNANRPTFWTRPSQFRWAESRGIKNLPGSDPLPFPEEVQRVGHFGVVLEGVIDFSKPVKRLKQLLTDPSTVFKYFGSEETPFRFFRNQLRMQLRQLG